MSTSSPSTAIRPSASPLQFLQSIIQYRHLLWQLIQRDVASRYRGSWAGLLWALLLPCTMLGVYLFVFGHVFTPMRGGGFNSKFALSLFAGILLHGFLAECLARAPNAILSQPSYVKKVVFPVQLLPLTVAGTAIVQLCIGTGVLLLATAGWRGLSWHIGLLPLVWLPLICLGAGISLALAALSVYLRDIAQMTGFISTVLLFMSPVFYPLSSAPPGWQRALLFNPITIPVEGTRSLLEHGQWPNLPLWGIHAVVSGLMLQAGWWLFQRTRKGFADVI